MNIKIKFKFFLWGRGHPVTPRPKTDNAKTRTLKPIMGVNVCNPNNGAYAIRPCFPHNKHFNDRDASHVFGFRIRVLALSVLGGALRGYPPSPKAFKAFDFNLFYLLTVTLCLITTPPPALFASTINVPAGIVLNE